MNSAFPGHHSASLQETSDQSPIDNSEEESRPAAGGDLEEDSEAVRNFSFKSIIPQGYSLAHGFNSMGEGVTCCLSSAAVAALRKQYRPLFDPSPSPVPSVDPRLMRL